MYGTSMDSLTTPAAYTDIHEMLECSSPQPGTRPDFLTALGDRVLNSQNGENILRQGDVPKPRWTATPLWIRQGHLGQPNFPLTVVAGGSGPNSPKPAASGTGPSSTCRDDRAVPMQVWCDRSIRQPQQQQEAFLKADEDASTCKHITMAKGDNNNRCSMTIDIPPIPAADSPRGNLAAKDIITEADVKQMDSSDCSDHMDEQEDKGINRTVSKNLVSERKRRKKLNEGLYTLRALVPRISKMDKASIIGDAIDYVRELQKEVEDLQAAISDVEASRTSGNLAVEDLTQGAQITDSSMITEDLEKVSRDSTPGSTDEATTEQKILKLDVAKMEEKSYHLRIFCTKGPGVFVQLMRSLEALGMEVLSANLTSFEENILNTFIAEIKDLEAMKTEELKAAILDVAARFGLQT